MSISISKAKALGASAVVIGSAGNAGAAAAAYAARAGIPCYVMVPASTPPERVAQIQLYGARVILVRGSVTDCIDLIARVYRERGWHNVTTASAYNPFQADSEKAIAYEMAKASGWEVPDWLFVPIGGGGILSGIYRGQKSCGKRASYRRAIRSPASSRAAGSRTCSSPRGTCPAPPRWRSTRRS